MNVGELIAKLQDVPADWEVAGTRSGSLEVWDGAGYRYAYVFTDERPTKIKTDHRRKRGLESEESGDPAIPMGEGTAGASGHARGL